MTEEKTTTTEVEAKEVAETLLAKPSAGKDPAPQEGKPKESTSDGKDKK